MESRPASGGAARAAVLAVVGGTMVVLLLATWAASTGPQEVLRGAGPERLGLPSPSATPSEALELLGPAGEDAPRPSDEESPVVAVIVLVLVLVVALGLAIVLLLVVRHLWRLRPPALEQGEHVDLDALDGAARAAARAAVAADADTQRRLLADGDPRNAIVACWYRFEVQAGLAGVARRGSETSTELGRRVLELAGVDPAAVDGLAHCFREARFSRHEIGEDARERAESLLATVHAGLESSPEVRR